MLKTLSRTQSSKDIEVRGSLMWRGPETDCRKGVGAEPQSREWLVKRGHVKSENSLKQGGQGGVTWSDHDWVFADFKMQARNTLSSRSSWLCRHLDFS